MKHDPEFCRRVAEAIGLRRVSETDYFFDDSEEPPLKYFVGADENTPEDALWFAPDEEWHCAMFAAEKVGLFWPCLLTKDVNGKDPWIIYKWDDARRDNLMFVSDVSGPRAICEAILKLKELA